MSILDDVRNALQPLIDQDIVHKVEWGTITAYGMPTPGQLVRIAVFVNSGNPEDHREEIEKLAKQTGHNSSIMLHPNYSRE